MTGNNTMNICTADMVEIVQHYFNTVLFAEGKAPKVTLVKAPSGNSYATDNTFTVSMEAPEKV